MTDTTTITDAVGQTGIVGFRVEARNATGFVYRVEHPACTGYQAYVRCAVAECDGHAGPHATFDAAVEFVETIHDRMVQFHQARRAGAAWDRTLSGKRVAR